MKLRAKLLLFSATLLSCVAGVSGATTSSDFSDFFTNRMPPLNWSATPPNHMMKFQATAGPSGYNPLQIRTAYGLLNVNGSGAGQKIAIIDAYGSATIQKDLDTFCTTFGIPKTTVAIYYPQGKVTHVDKGWALETSLDVEWAHAIAPSAQIILVVAKSSSFTDLLGAVNYAVGLGAKQVSMSWGGSEFSSELLYDSTFNQPGVTFTASSGDNGAGVLWPACSPNVIAVGGTTLKLDGYGNVISEVAWKGSGGGVSTYEKRPAYQNGWNAKTGRGVPDVSYCADPATGFAVYISALYGTSGWVQVGGTSAGAPQWAAISAIANGFRTVSLATPVSSLYAIAATDYSYYFRDVTSGNNKGYFAIARYDYVTGLGSPFAANIILQLGK